MPILKQRNTKQNKDAVNEMAAFATKFTTFSEGKYPSKKPNNKKATSPLIKETNNIFNKEERNSFKDEEENTGFSKIAKIKK